MILIANKTTMNLNEEDECVYVVVCGDRKIERERSMYIIQEFISVRTIDYYYLYYLFIFQWQVIQ